MKTLNWKTVKPAECKGTNLYLFRNCGKFNWQVLVNDKQNPTMFRIQGTRLRVKDSWR